MTKKSELYQIRKKEIRDSRIKETRNFIRSKSFSSLMNNHKWFQIFELIEEQQSEFELKTVRSFEIRKADSILELEKSSILIDNSGEFIEFLELEQITLKNTSELKSELNNLNVDFYEESDKIKIRGYSK
ncbi:DUF6678 family protein [Marixanthomonas sp. SCSIO 43207]|uniref:DUF6678 family protein n=1 Tax=Marixanthomonas sp. SCSIO 43207 TaxID=2779360 RepID=UPI00351D96CF